MKKTKLAVFLCLVLVFVFGYATMAFAYTWYINYAKGLYTVPTTINVSTNVPSNFTTAIHNSCATWNVGGQGNLVFRNTSTTSTTAFPSYNNKFNITYGPLSDSSFLALTNYTSTSSWNVIEADIQISSAKPIRATGEAGFYDCQSLVTHEIGHVL